MPLHLLGKKSWNVYNPANIERVRRDEAAAQAREEEAERRMDEYDAARRLAILRGERPPSPPPDLLDEGQQPRRDGANRGPKRRRIAGEDDTDRDIRLARETAEHGREQQEQLIKFSENKKEANDAPLMNREGHIDLFPVDHKAMRKAEKNAEREAEEAKKRQEFEDQYTMRLSNAAGRDGLGKPWYANASKGSTETSGPGVMEELEEPSKNVWGREDPGRKDRQRMRMNASDPLAFMKKAQVQLKDAERDRRRWAAEREREMFAMRTTNEKELRSERKKHSSRGDKEADDIDDLEGFDLNAPPEDRKLRHERSHDRTSSRHHRRHRSRSRSRNKDRRRSHRSRSRSRSPDGDRRKSHYSSRKRSRSREHRRDQESHRSSRRRDERDEQRRHGAR